MDVKETARDAAKETDDDPALLIDPMVLKSLSPAISKLFCDYADTEIPSTALLGKSHFLLLCRDANLTPSLVSQIELMHLYSQEMSMNDTTASSALDVLESQLLGFSDMDSSGMQLSDAMKVNEGNAGLRLSVNGVEGIGLESFKKILVRIANVVFTGADWDALYPTIAEKLRVLLFWVEQGMGKGGGKSQLIFDGNTSSLLAGLEKPPMRAEWLVGAANRSSSKFSYAGVTFSMACFDIAGLGLPQPLLIPHVEALDAELRPIFAWYCCMGRGAKAATIANEGYTETTMRSSQFLRFLKDAGLLGRRISHGIADIIFKKVAAAMGRNMNAEGAWKVSQFNRKQISASMVHRKISYEGFLVGLADVAARTFYKKKLSVGPDFVSESLYRIILDNILPLISRFWSSVSERHLYALGSSSGRVAQKLGSDGWQMRWLQIHKLEKILASAIIVEAFNLHKSYKNLPAANSPRGETENEGLTENLSNELVYRSPVKQSRPMKTRSTGEGNRAPERTPPSTARRSMPSSARSMRSTKSLRVAQDDADITSSVNTVRRHIHQVLEITNPTGGGDAVGEEKEDEAPLEDDPLRKLDALRAKVGSILARISDEPPERERIMQENARLL